MTFRELTYDIYLRWHLFINSVAVTLGFEGAKEKVRLGKRVVTFRSGEGQEERKGKYGVKVALLP